MCYARTTARGNLSSMEESGSTDDSHNLDHSRTCDGEKMGIVRDGATRVDIYKVSVYKNRKAMTITTVKLISTDVNCQNGIVYTHMQRCLMLHI